MFKINVDIWVGIYETTDDVIGRYVANVICILNKSERRLVLLLHFVFCYSEELDKCNNSQFVNYLIDLINFLYYQ